MPGSGACGLNVFVILGIFSECFLWEMPFQGLSNLSGLYVHVVLAQGGLYRRSPSDSEGENFLLPAPHLIISTERPTNKTFVDFPWGWLLPSCSRSLWSPDMNLVLASLLQASAHAPASFINVSSVDVFDFCGSIYQSTILGCPRSQAFCDPTHTICVTFLSHLELWSILYFSPMRSGCFPLSPLSRVSPMGPVFSLLFCIATLSRIHENKYPCF